MNVEQSIAMDVRLTLRSPKLLDKSEPPALQFVLQLVVKESGKVALSVPGWRVWKGKLYPPARVVKGKYFSCVNLENRAFERALEDLACRNWSSEYPTVSFPEAEEIQDEIPPEEFDENDQ